MKVAVWRRAVAEHVLGHLPGRWGVVPWVLYVDPPDWFARAVIFSLLYNRLTVSANVQLLPVPFPAWSANDAIQLGGGTRAWPAPATVDEASPVMADIVELIQAEALPFFEDHATLDGRLRLLRQRIRDLDSVGGAWQDFTVDEELTVVHILRGDLEAARETAEWSARAAEVDPLPQARQARDRVRDLVAAAEQNPAEALKLLAQRAAEQRQTLKLPT